MSGLSPGSHGRSGDLAAQSQPPDCGHKHLMTLALENPAILPRTNFAWSSQRGSVAASVTTPIHQQTEAIRRATPSLSRAASQRPAASLFIGSHPFIMPATFATPINTHKAGILLRFSPIHF